MDFADDVRTLTRQAFARFISERINARLQSALEREDAQASKSTEAEAQPEQQSKEETEFTPLELEALQVVKATLRDLDDLSYHAERLRAVAGGHTSGPAHSPDLS